MKGPSPLQYGSEICFMQPNLQTHTPSKKKTIKKAKTRPSGVLRFAPIHQKTTLGIGKVQADVASFLYPLFAYDLIQLKGKVIMAPPVLSFFTEIVLHVDIYLNEDFFIVCENDKKIRQIPEYAMISDAIGDLIDYAELSSSLKDHRTDTFSAFEDFQIDQLLQADQMRILQLPEHDEHSEYLKCSLRGYQKQALGWMLQREKGDTENAQDNGRLHPLWSSFRCQDGFEFYFNKFCFQVSRKMISAVPASSGGILADEMGMGKTIEVIALLAHQKSAEGCNSKTLIVTPMSLMSQWKSELDEHSTLTSMVFYGHQRLSIDLQSLLKDKIDVVLTTYGVLASESSEETSELFAVDWRRVVLDEAHFIKNRATNQAKAAFSLKCESKWCLTGTPVQNGLDDVFSLIHFIGESPWSEFSFWNRMISKPFQKQDQKALRRLHALLQPLLLRRTKAMRLENGQSLVTLPPKDQKVVCLEFTQEEHQFYQSLFRKSKKKFEGMVQQGDALSHFTHILELLLRLRQACNHPFLVLGVKQHFNDSEKSSGIRSRLLSHLRGDNANFSESYVDSLIDNLKGNDDERQCPICLDMMESPVISKCGHLFCPDCLFQVMGREESCMCPVCRAFVIKSELIRCSMDQSGLSVDDGWIDSSKTIAVVTNIKNALAKDETVKSIVFSQVWVCSSTYV